MTRESNNLLMSGCTCSTMCLDSAGTMHGCQMQTAAYNKRVSARTGVKGWKGITNCLNSRRCESSALTNVEVSETVIFVSAFDRLPYTVLVSDTTMGKRIHCSIRYVLAIVETK